MSNLMHDTRTTKSKPHDSECSVSVCLSRLTLSHCQVFGSRPSQGHNSMHQMLISLNVYFEVASTVFCWLTLYLHKLNFLLTLLKGNLQDLFDILQKD